MKCVRKEQSELTQGTKNIMNEVSAQYKSFHVRYNTNIQANFEDRLKGP